MNLSVMYLINDNNEESVIMEKNSYQNQNKFSKIITFRCEILFRRIIRCNSVNASIHLFFSLSLSTNIS